MDLMVFACAQSHSVDQRRNYMSLFNVIESVNSPSFPLVLPMVVVAIVLRRKIGESDPDIRLKVELDGKQLANGSCEFKFGEHITARCFVELNGLVVKQPGLLRLTLVRSGRRWATWDIPVANSGGPNIQIVSPADIPALPSPQAKPNRRGQTTKRRSGKSQPQTRKKSRRR